MKKERLPLIPRKKEFKEFLEMVAQQPTTGLLGERKYTARDTGLSSRVISHWDRNKILPDGVKGKKGWRKFTLSEMVWIKVVMRLRNFGFPLSKIAEIKKQIMECDREHGTYPLFDFFVGQAWKFDDPHIIVLADGAAGIATPPEIELLKRRLPPNRKDMLLISLKSVLEELGIDAVRAKLLMPLTDQEAILVASITRGSREVKAKISDGKIKEIEQTVVISDHPDLREINGRIQEGGEYTEVTTKYQKGVRQSAEVKKKIRL
jgi:DNA-binding transcriptional MerR regulator